MVIAEQARLLEEQAEAIRELRADVVALAAEVRDLRRKIGRNSGNSSMAPSADDLPGRKPPAPKPKRGGGRKPGGQPGRDGAHLEWRAIPDDTVPYFPGGACACGADLSGAQDLGVARSFQQLEIPEPAARRIQHDLHLGVCGCGREHVAARPPGLPDAAVSIGPNLRALAVYLLVFQHVPVERCQQLISDVAGARVSAGFIHSCLRKAAELAAGVIKLIRTLITAAHVAGFDETTLRAGPAGEKKYVLGAFTEQYSLLFLGARTLESFRDFGVLPDFAGIAVTDRYVNYVRHEAHCYIAC